MASSNADSQSAADDHALDTPESTPPNSTESVDSKLSALADLFTHKLTTQTYERWCIDGERTAVPGRVVSVPDAFELRDLLLSVLAFRKGEVPTHAKDMANEGRKLKGSQNDAINRIVAERIDGPLRDLSLESKHQQNELRKAHAEIAKLASENSSQASKIHGLESEMSRRTRTIEGMVKTAVQEHPAIKNASRVVSDAVRPLQRDIASLERQSASAIREDTVDNKISAAISAVEGQIAAVKSDQDDTAQELGDQTADLHAKFAGLHDYAVTVQSRVKSAEKDHNHLARRVTKVEHKARDDLEYIRRLDHALEEVEERMYKHDEYFASMSER